MTNDLARISRIPQLRQQEIYLLALRNGSVDVTELARHFDVTTETIRRDLSELQEHQQIRRVHGGAVPVQRQAFEPMIEARDVQNTAEKHDIAQLAVHQVPERGSVIIDSGSTGRCLAEIFPTDRNVQVITNSLMTGLTLARRGVQELTVLGGSGSLNAAGNTERLHLSIGGSGRVQVGQLQARDAVVSIGGSGQATVWAKKSLNLSVAGSGDINYYGDPQISKSVMGSGTIKRLGVAPQN